MKIILFVGDLNTYGRSYGRYITLQKLNHKIIPLSHSIVVKNGLIKKPSLLYRISNKLMLPIDQTNINKLILDKVKKNKIDIIWIENGITIFPNTLKKIKKIFPYIKLISLSEDDMFQRHNQSFWYLRGLKYYDLVFTTKEYNIKELKSLGAKKTSLFLDSYDERYHKPIRLNKNDIKLYTTDVSAIGAYEKERASSLLYLAKNGVEISVWGNGWNLMLEKHKLLKVNYNFLYGESYSKAIIASKFNLNFLRKINRDQITSRSIEIPACGGFMLTERTDKHKKTFKEGVEADYFDNDKELLSKIKYYLKNNEERKIIATNGFNRCINTQLSMKFQLEKIINIIIKGT